MSQRTCIRCGSEFESDNGSRGQWERFCSDKCRMNKPRRQTQPCSVSGCGKAARSTKSPYCETHYYRLRRTGSLDVIHPQRPHRGRCVYPGCGQLDRGPAGYCAMHQSRINRHGDASVKLKPGQAAGPTHPAYKGEAVTYSGAHMRVRAWRGRADQYSCIDCGRQAQQWSYDHRDPAEMSCREGPFSVDVWHYEPRCVSCHKAYDLAMLDCDSSRASRIPD